MTGTLGVLLAGGRGARLALGMPKALVRLGGATLLERALSILAAVSDEIVVAAPESLALPLPESVAHAAGPRSTPRLVHDPPGAPGPLAGMVAALASRPFERALVLGVDFPFMEPALLAALLERLEDHQAVVPEPGGFPQPLAAAYAPRAAAFLAACHAAGEGAPTRAIRSLETLRLDDAELARMPGGLSCFFNLNTPADLGEAERRLAARAAMR